MKTRDKITTVIIPFLVWVFYGFWMLPIFLNAETWFYGIKFSGYSAILIHLLIGIVGIFFGWLIHKKKKFAYFGVLVLFLIVLHSIMVNRFS